MAYPERYPGERSLDRMLRERRLERMKREREAMTPAAVAEAMRGIVRAKMQRDGQEAVITLADFQQANLPMDKVTPIARHIVQAMSDEIRSNRDRT
jgi:hypothetical protein